MADLSDIQLETPRLRLRPLAPGDAQRLFEIHADPEFMRYWSTPPWTSLEQAAAVIEKDRVEMARGTHIRLGIVLRETDRLIGTCTLFKMDPQSRRAELGYGIDRAHWRRGYMVEAVTRLLAFGFTELNLNRVGADIDPRNVASAGSLEKLGFLREGLLRERWIVGEEVSDTALYGLLAKDWKAGRGST